MKVEWSHGTVEVRSKDGPDFARLAGYVPVVRVSEVRKMLVYLSTLDEKRKQQGVMELLASLPKEG